MGNGEYEYEGRLYRLAFGWTDSYALHVIGIGTSQSLLFLPVECHFGVYQFCVVVSMPRPAVSRTFLLDENLSGQILATDFLFHQVGYIVEELLGSVVVLQ